MRFEARCKEFPRHSTGVQDECQRGAQGAVCGEVRWMEGLWGSTQELVTAQHSKRFDIGDRGKQGVETMTTPGYEMQRGVVWPLVFLQLASHTHCQKIVLVFRSEFPA